MVFTFVLFVTVFVGSTGWFLYRTTKNSLDNDLGDKLMAISQAVTTQIDGMFLMQLTPGDETTRTYSNLLNKLKEVKEATKVERLYIFNKDNQSLVDTDPGIPIGTEYIKLKFDKSELEFLWQGHSVHTVPFTGEDGVYYKSGYAPIKVNGKIVAAVGVDASATFIKTISNFRSSVVMFAITSIAITIAVGFVFSLTITRSIHKLVKAAGDMGKGELNKEIHINSKDELGYLGNAMENMRKGIIQRDNQLKMMLAGVAHEIRNPLGGIGIFAGLLAEELSGQSKEHAEKIIKEVRKLNDIITQFLEYARPAEPVPMDLCIEDIIDDAHFIISPEADKAGIEFVQDFDSEHKNVHVDPEQIKRVFINIFKNSIQAMSQKGKISVRTQSKDGFMEIIVTDNGSGISDENIRKIFDPFFTTKEKGTGLGLAIVKRIVESNGGRIAVESKLGEYTAFTISLPMSMEERTKDG